jgi:hypothetical protein
MVPRSRCWELVRRREPCKISLQSQIWGPVPRHRFSVANDAAPAPAWKQRAEPKLSPDTDVHSMYQRIISDSKREGEPQMEITFTFP